MFKNIVIGLIVVFLLYFTINLINLTRYKTKTFTREIFSSFIENPIQDGNTSTEDFIKSSSQIEVTPIHSGDLNARLSIALNLNHPTCSEMEDEDILIPIFAYLIHHEKYGYFLIDSGCDSTYSSDPYGPMKGFILPFVMPGTILDPEDAISEQLSADILNNIQAVFFTHLHLDHTSGLSGIPNNPLYIAGKGEKSFTFNGIIEPNHFKNSDTIYMIDFDSDEALTLPLGKVIDIFGDQTLWAISTPGHSKGHISYLINTNDYPIFIAGDACILNKSLETGVGPGTSAENIEFAQKTFDNIYNFAKDNPEVKIWPGHDFPE